MIIFKNMIFSRKADGKTFLTTADTQAKVIAIDGDFVRIWDYLQTCPRIDLSRSKIFLDPSIESFLFLLEKQGMLPREMSLKEVRQLVSGEFSGLVPQGSCNITEPIVALPVFGSEMYGGGGCFEAGEKSEMAQCD